MGFLVIKDCVNCDKRNVCSVMDNRKKLDTKVQELIDEFQCDNGIIKPLGYTSSCGEYSHDTRERSFA